MSKRPDPRKQAKKKHAAAMHNARYMLGKEFDALEAGRNKFQLSDKNGDMGVANNPTAVATGTLAEFMENGAPGDVYVERGIEIVKEQSKDGQLGLEDVVELLSEIGAYPVSVSSPDAVQIDPSKPVELSFISHEPRDYQVPMIQALEGEHLPRPDLDGPVVIFDSISDLSKADIEGVATAVEEPKIQRRFSCPALTRAGFVTPDLPEEVLSTVKKAAGEE